VVHAAGRSAWIELGLNRVARLHFDGTRLKGEVFEQFPWSILRWVNVGVVGDLVVLTGPEAGRVYFDERTGTFTEAPSLDALLNSFPSWISRVNADRGGTIWASHERGVVRFLPEADGYRLESSALRLIHERNPLIQIVEGEEVWASTGATLLRLERGIAAAPENALQPVVDQITDARTGRVLFTSPQILESPRIAFRHNSLRFRFFAGSYFVKRVRYDFAGTGRSLDWTLSEDDSVLTLPNLREGHYHLEVRVSDATGALGTPLQLGFEILPPWYRTWLAFAGYLLGGGALAYLAVAWTLRRMRARNRMLQRVVGEKTQALEAAMRKLEEETRSAAIHSERVRLAGEIHDSLQQGLSGLSLQLDSTLRLPAVPDGVQRRIQTALKMVAFSRQELQHTLWNLQSPLLEDGDLASALRSIASFVSANSSKVEVLLTGLPRPLPHTTAHHLLRIAQEAMTNALRHGEAERIEVHLDYRPDALVLSVRDDGRGFSPEAVLADHPGHFGLRGMRLRAENIDARFEIRSAPAAGTTVTAHLPLSPSAPPNPS
jgi:signal transduction histidine kinase